MPTTPPNTKLARNASTEEVIVSEHLAELRGRVRLLTWISGICWTLLVLLGGLLITGTLDWLIHFDDSGTRLVFGLGLLGGSGWMVWRQLIAPLRQQLTGAFLASRVERRFPGLKNRVLSAVEFLEHRLDAKLGSTELQKAVVGQALKDLERIETSDVVETKAIRNVTIAGTLVCAVGAVVLMLHPLEAATSVQRLMFPFANVPWPRAVELQLVRPDFSSVTQTQDQPLLIARGDILELYVRNTRGRLPERVWFEYRSSDDAPLVREPLRQTTLRDESGRSHEAAVISWVAARGTLSFRATGGDDNVMPFHRVEVVPPPTTQSLQVTVTPPAYSKRPVETLPQGVGHIQGLLGTKVEISAVADKPLKSAKLRIGEHPAVPLVVDQDGRQFTAAFEVKDPLASSYWFELTDTQGFTDREAVRYELRGIADGVPEVTIELPIADVMLTADAELPVKVLAKDDLGLKEVRISYQFGDEEKFRSIPLFSRAPRTDDDGTVDESRESGEPKSLGPQRQELDYLWKMADLKPEPGTKIVFRAEATDDCDLGPPHLGKSIPRTITIVSGSEKQKELAARVGDLLDDLQQATQLQQRAQQETQELQTQLEKVGELRPQDMDQLSRTELDQRQTASRLNHPADGVETQARQLLDEFRANHLNDGATEQRLERLANELGRLAREELPNAEQALTQAQKLAEQASSRDADSAKKAPSRPERPSKLKSGSGKTQANEKSSRDSQSGSPEVGSDKSEESKDSQDDATVASEQFDEKPQSGGKSRPSGPSNNKDKSKRGSKASSSKGESKDGQSPSDEANAKPDSTGDQSSDTTEKSQDQPQDQSDKRDGDSPSDSAKPERSDKSNNGKSQQKSKTDKPGKLPSATEKPLESALAEAHAQQTQSLETLKELQESLAEWRDRRDVSRDLNSVIAEQEAIQKDSAEMAQHTLSKPAGELTKQEKAELNKLSARQNKVAEQLDQFKKQLEQTANSIEKNDPESAEKFNDAGQELSQQATAGRLREAAEQIAENRMGAAAEAQQKALDDLHDVERMMKRQPNADTEQFLKQTQEAQQEFQQLRQDQQNLADQAQELAKQPDSPEKQDQMRELMEQQEELTERMAKAERKLEKLRLRGPAEAAHRARKRLNEMMKHMQEAEDGEELQQAMDEALDDLEQVERELVLEKRIAQERLAFEQLEKIEDELKSLRSRQEAVVEETVRLQEAKVETDSLSRGQLKTLKELAETERTLQHAAEQMQQHMASAEVFSLVLRKLSRNLMLAADRLGERETAAATQALEQDAIRKIDNLLAVLKKEQKKQEQPEPKGEKPEQLGQEPEEQEEKPEEAQPPGDMIPQLAQLKLLKSLQEEYLERTESLEKFRDKDGKLPEAMAAEKEELAREQAELADFARNLIAKFLQQQPDRNEPNRKEPEEEKTKTKDASKEKDPTKIDP